MEMSRSARMGNTVPGNHDITCHERAISLMYMAGRGNPAPVAGSRDCASQALQWRPIKYKQSTGCR